MRTAKHKYVPAKDSGLTKLDVTPGGGVTSGTVDRSVPGGREVMSADQNVISISMKEAW